MQNQKTTENILPVTVVIPNFNGKEYLDGCLKSLLADGGKKSFRILVVDNGSTDGSCQLVREKYPQAHLIALPENTGFCHAVNVGIEEADTPFVILLNNDTRVLPGFTEGLLSAIKKDERLFGVSACMLDWERHELLDDAGDQYCMLGWAFSRGKGKPAPGYDRPVEVFAACGGAAIYRKTVFEKIGLFDENHFAYLEDIDIGYRARIYGYRNAYEPSARVLHAGSASSGSRYNEFKTRLSSANNVYLIGKNMPLLQWLLNLPFLLAGFFIKTLFFMRKRMGILYVKGLWNGLKKTLQPEGKQKKVPFRWKHLGNYLSIQWLLFINCFRLFLKK